MKQTKNPQNNSNNKTNTKNPNQPNRKKNPQEIESVTFWQKKEMGILRKFYVLLTTDP